MKALISWFNDRTGFGDLCGRVTGEVIPSRGCCGNVLPTTILFAFCVQAITGFFLWVYYSPSTQTAWESVYFVQHTVWGGWLLRAIHHYSAHVLLAMLILLVVQSIFTGLYRAPRELVFWATVGLGLFALAAVLTGDLLSWDQNGYAATKTRTGFLVYLPWVGESLHRLAIGGPGPEMGHLALTRFFALHVGLFGGGFLALLFLRGYLSRRANAKSWGGSCTAAPDLPKGVAVQLPPQHSVQLPPQHFAAPFWPNQAWRSAAACLIVLAVILLLACQHGTVPPEAGVPTLSPADPANIYVAARPEWFLVGVFELSQWFPGGWEIVPIFIIPGALVCIVLLMPFVASRRIGHGLNIVFTLFVLASLTWLSWASYAKDRANPSHQKEIALEQIRSLRICELIRHEGIPPTGAMTLLRNDPKTQGYRLFTQQCASCHSHAREGDVWFVEDIRSEKPTAPNLFVYASRPWLTGLLDPKQVVGPEYFGNTKFRKMAGFVKARLVDLDADEKQSLEKVIMAVSAEAQLPSQREIDVRDAKSIEEGRELLVEEYSCTDCHKFHYKGQLGDAPDLTGYGSKQWIAGILGNPAEKRFYGKSNVMPCYAPSVSNPSENSLNPHQIELLTDWLRGEWYEEEKDE